MRVVSSVIIVLLLCSCCFLLGFTYKDVSVKNDIVKQIDDYIFIRCDVNNVGTDIISGLNITIKE